MSSQTMLDKIPALLIVGDVHGKQEEYVEFVQGYKYSLQVGDMGFGYEDLDKLDPKNHKFIGGNHDNYDILKEGKVPHYLNNFGTWEVPGFPYGEIFYVRGAYSVDRLYRTMGVSWWPEEELTEAELEEALLAYRKEKPDFIVTHDAPQIVVDQIGLQDFSHLRTRTSAYLQMMFEEHKPKFWIFGHHHKHLNEVKEGCRFICLPELSGKAFDLREENEDNKSSVE